MHSLAKFGQQALLCAALSISVLAKGWGDLTVGRILSVATTSRPKDHII